MQGQSRFQVEFGSLEDIISVKNPVQVIDAFLDMKRFKED
jgi:hypothetical protein